MDVGILGGLFTAAEERLEVKAVRQPKGSIFSIIEVALQE